MVEPSLEDVFPGLRGQSYQIKSPRDHRYNCIAFAAGDDRNWWWPGAAGQDSWPAGIARAETEEAFRDAFATMGYVVCDDDQLEPGYENVALFTLAGVPKHASRQLPSGLWVSKPGPREDIEHAFHDLTGVVVRRGGAGDEAAGGDAAGGKADGIGLWVDSLHTKSVPNLGHQCSLSRQPIVEVMSMRPASAIPDELGIEANLVFAGQEGIHCRRTK